jgi:hypothetical protein
MGPPHRPEPGGLGLKRRLYYALRRYYILSSGSMASANICLLAAPVRFVTT